MKRVFDTVSRGLVLITLGVIFFLINYGLLTWDFWLNIINLWPLLLILGGISLLFNKRISFSTVLLVFLLVLVGYTLIFGNRASLNLSRYYNFERDLSLSAKTLPINVKMEPEIKKTNIKLDLGGAKVQVQADSNHNSTYLINGDYRYETRFGFGEPKSTAKLRGDRMDFDFSSEKGTGVGKGNLDLNLSEKPIYSFDINAGAVNGDFDLSNLMVDNLDLDTGAGKFVLKFGDKGDFTKVKVDGAASDITLAVPENVGLRVHLNGVVGSTDFMGSGLIMGENEWLSPNYENMQTKIDVDISMAAGSVHLERQPAVTANLLPLLTASI